MLNLVTYYLYKDAYKSRTVSFQEHPNPLKLSLTSEKVYSTQPFSFWFDVATGIIRTLTSNNAFYHKGCCGDFNGSHYERLVKKIEKQRS